MMRHASLSFLPCRLGLLAMALCSWFLADAAQAAYKVAKQSGSWTNTATWGGAVPAPYDEVAIPAGLSVSIPEGKTITLASNGGGGKLTIGGALSVSGQLVVPKFIILAGATLTNAKSGQVIVNQYYENYGSVVNRGLILNQGILFYDYGLLTNELGATLDNRSSLSLQSKGLTNRGTISNNAHLDLYAPLENYGTVLNASGRTLGIYRDLRNFAGAHITSHGAVKVDRAVTIHNDGTLTHSSSDPFDNQGIIVNSCSGVIAGTLAGKAPTETCSSGAPTTQAPKPESASTSWQDISAGLAWTSISVGSKSRLTGTSSSGAGATSHVLIWTDDGFAYHHLPSSMTKVAQVQASIGADGTWWGLKSDDSIWRFTGSDWAQVPGALMQVSVASAQNIWGVNRTHKVYRWNETSWTQVQGSLAQVSTAADGTVWGITPKSKIVRWNGASWQEMPGEAIQVAVGSSSNIWVVNAGGNVYSWNGTGWNLVSEAGKCKAISAAADGSVAVIRSDNGAVFKKP